MSVFNQTVSRSKQVTTHEGGIGRKSGPEEELAILTVSTFLNDSYYETGNKTAQRMKELSGKVSGDFLLRLAVVARNDFNMRTSPVAVLALYTLHHGQPPASIINKVFLRGDEIGDYLGAVSAFSNRGKVTPAAVRFGRRVLQERLTQRNALRYSGGNRKWSLAKAIRITHALQGAHGEKEALMNLVLNWHREGSLAKGWGVTDARFRNLLPVVENAVLGEDAGTVSWERTRSAGASWNDVVADMGYMATLRNLNNFFRDDDFEHWQAVIDQLSDRDEVLRSQQLPYRFLAAHRAIESEGRSHRWYNRVADALETALEHSLDNLPKLEGSTLVVVDTSGSMTRRLSESSEMSYVDIASLFGASLSKMQDTTVVAFSTTAEKVRFSANDTVLSRVSKIVGTDVGWGTNLTQVDKVVNPGDYDNVVIFSDMQFSMGSGYGISVPKSILKHGGSVFAVNLASYEAQMMRSGENFYSIGGWSDATLKLISTLSGNRSLVDVVNGYEL